MKTILFFISFFVTSPLWAYQTVLTCENGAMVIDRYSTSEGKTYFQIVIRDQNIKDYFISQNILGTKESQAPNELIFDGLESLSLKAFVPSLDIKDLKVFTYAPNPGSITIVATNTNEQSSANWNFQHCQ